MAGSRSRSRKRPGLRLERKALLALLLVPLACIATWWFITRPATADQQLSAQELSSLQRRLDEVNARLTMSQSGKGPKAATLLTTAQGLDRALPAEPATIAVTAEVEALARDNGLKLDTLNPGRDPSANSTAAPKPSASPGAGSTKGGASSVDYSVSVSGPADSVPTFFAALQRVPELVTVSDVSVKYTGRTAAATFVLSEWYMPAVKTLR